jgi:multidrug resistance efflux pump
VQASEQAVALAERNLAQAIADGPGDLAAARAQRDQARLALAQAEADRSETELLAPFDGVVTNVATAVGLRAAPGSPVLTLAQTRPLHFTTTNLGERNVGDIAPGARATITLNSFPEDPLAATVLRIAPQASVDEAGLTSFTVTLEPEATELPLRAGMTGRVEIQLGG